MDESSEEVSPYSASLEKENISCCRKGMKSHPDSYTYCFFIIKSLNCWKIATHTFTPRVLVKAPCILGREQRKYNFYSRRGARTQNCAPGESRPRIPPRGRAGPLRESQPLAQRPSVCVRLKLNQKNRGYTCPPPQAKKHV